LAPQLLNSIIAAGKSAVSRAARSIYRQVAAAEAHHRKQRPWLDRTADAAPTATAALPDHTQLLQRWRARGMERNIEQL
jgi:hypothetical protein